MAIKDHQGFKRKSQLVLLCGLVAVGFSGCAVLTVVDTAVTVTSVAVKTTAKVAGAVVGVAADGVRAATKTKPKKQDAY